MKVTIEEKNKEVVINFVGKTAAFPIELEVSGETIEQAIAKLLSDFSSFFTLQE